MICSSPPRRLAIHDSYTGTVLNGTYRITRLLGEGGMGVVYEAVHQRLPQKRFAVKVLRHAVRAVDDSYKRFRREAQATTEIGHPCIIDVVDYNQTEEGYPYLVMEYLEGEDLEHRIGRDGPLSIDEALALMEQACSALQAAHQHGIIHRDVKPENIFLVTDPDGQLRIKILDFGLAKMVNDASALTAAGAVMGTARFMSPEQIQGQPADHRTDIFALGAVLYYAVTATVPFDGESLITLARQICEAPVPLLSGQLESVPPGWDAALGRAMAKDRERRYAQAKDFAAELRAGLELWQPAGGEDEERTLARTPPSCTAPAFEPTLPPDDLRGSVARLPARSFTDAASARRRRRARLVLVVLGLCALGGAGVLLTKLASSKRSLSSESGPPAAGSASPGSAPSYAPPSPVEAARPDARPRDAGRADGSLPDRGSPDLAGRAEAPSKPGARVKKDRRQRVRPVAEKNPTKVVPSKHLEQKSKSSDNDDLEPY